jgi:hypothetical protein
MYFQKIYTAQLATSQSNGYRQTVPRGQVLNIWRAQHNVKAMAVALFSYQNFS